MKRLLFAVLVAAAVMATTAMPAAAAGDYGRVWPWSCIN